MKLNATNCKEPWVWEGGGGEGVSQEIGAVDLAAICVATLRSVLEYNVAWLDITPFLPICVVQ